MEKDIKAKIENYLRKRVLDRKAMFIPMAAVMMFMLVGYAAVDQEEPVIHTSTLTLSYGEVLDIDMLDITDNHDKKEDLVISIDDKHVDYQQLGSYSVEVQATDNFNNVARKFVNVSIIDDQAPVFEAVEGNGGYYYEVPIHGSNDIGSYIKAIDNVDGDVTPFIEADKKLNTSKQGMQIINISVSDTAGNIATQKAHFFVADLEPPTITLLEGEEVFVDYKSKFKLSKFMKITDNLDKKLKPEVTGSVDTSVMDDTAEIKVVVTDKAGNTSKASITATVKDISGPKIVLSKKSIKIQKGTKFDPEDYLESAVDNVDGDMKSKIKFNKISTSSIGTYTVKYTGTDSNGNKSTAKLKVEVTFPGNEIVKKAMTKLGTPYRWGSTGPNSFDCSGFTQWVYRQNGIYIPRSSGAQRSAGKKISLSNLEVGDIVWRSGHVGIYIGGGRYVHAPHTGDVVKVSSMSTGRFTCGLRFR